MVVVTTMQDVLTTWLCNRIGLTPTPHIKCIGNIDSGGTLRGVVGFDGYNGRSVMMHVAGEGNWCSRSLLWAAFDYVFNVMGCKVAIGLVPSGNESALRFNRKIGFEIIGEINEAHPDGSLFIMTMRRNQCRWLKPRLGREVTSATSTSHG